MTDRCKLLIDSMSGIIWEANPETMELISISDNVSRMLGYSSKEWLNDKMYWINHTYSEDIEIVKSFFEDPTKLKKNNFDFRMVSADGKIISMTNFVSLVFEDDKLKSIAGVLLDTTEKTLLGNLEHLEKLVLELNAENNTALEETLKFYVLGLEHIFPNMKCSILKIQDGKAYNWASPSFTADYIEAVHGMSIGLNRGSCGTAAFLKERVVVSDIEHDEKWVDFKDAALRDGMRACWSYPIINTNGDVIATFAMYYNEIKVPAESELVIIDRSAALLRVIMENKLYASIVQELNAMILQGQELANFGTWQWDFKGNTAKWSDSLCKIYGVNPATHNATFESYINMVHPDDKERVKELLDRAHNNKTEITFEERIIRTDGEIRHLRSWFRVIFDDNGVPLKFIGASLDISQVIENNMLMDDIAWQQSHVVRAPLARIMGLVNLIKDKSLQDEGEQQKILDAIVASAHELDNIIRDIIHSTRKDY